MFGLAANWKRRRPDPLSRLAQAIDALGDRDRKQAAENDRLDRLRAMGATALFTICREFVDDLNQRLQTPDLVLDPPQFSPAQFRDPGSNMFQVSLRGRLVMVEFEGTSEPSSTDDFSRPYILHGVIRGLNQELLERNLVTEKSIFFCPHGDTGTWHFVDNRNYRSGKITQELLAIELERLL